MSFRHLSRSAAHNDTTALPSMIEVRPMTAADLSLGLRLSQEASWNQVPADWQRFLELQPDGCFVAEWDGLPVGTITTCIFGSVAWIAMVLVQASHRGRGIGTALLNHALEYLDGRGVVTVRLDATPLGQPVYERLGFVEQFRLARYEGVISKTREVSGVDVAVPEHWEALAALDRSVTSTDRRRFLLRLFAEHPQNVRYMRSGGRIAGFITARPGTRALMLGPCIGTPEAVGPLFADAGHRYAGQRVFVDVPLLNQAAITFVEGQGLTVQRHLTRMCRGVMVCERVESLWAGSGPEKG
jgi:GNAT superfamily N-acetyltransferase